MNLFKIVWRNEALTVSKIIESQNLDSAIISGKTDVLSKDYKLIEISQVFSSPQKQFINRQDDSSYGSRHYKSDRSETYGR